MLKILRDIVIVFKSRVDIKDSLSFFLLLAIFLSIPFYMNESLRFSIKGVLLPLNLVLVFALWMIIWWKTKNEVIKLGKSFNILLLALMIFVASQLISNLTNEVTSISYGMLIKIGICIGVTTLIYTALRTNEDFQLNYKFFLKLTIMASTLFLLYYILMNFIVYHNKFITTNYVNGSGAGKNQIQIYLALLTPLSYYHYNSKKSRLGFYFLAAHLLGSLLVGSRGLWISLTIGFIIHYLIQNHKMKRISVRKNSIFAFFFIFLIIGTAGTLFTVNNSVRIQKSVDKIGNYASERLVSIFINEEKNPNSSVSQRAYFNEFAIEKFKENPLFGVGIDNFVTLNKYKKLSHNDYMRFISEQGLLGLLAFILVLIIIIYSIQINNLPSLLVIPFIIDLNFINAYNFPLFWLLIGIYLAIPKLDSKDLVFSPKT